ncbi:hypothetical protein B0920_16410 [Massilia sp. KIM]|uniref:DUF1801 domain-containing protein n=1 Tax=Massilia sp. KIM TaxID=1955422 RepID=UPI00098FBB21|nr:DUF1801 domain-containing protein [Massilia sp. KIM]OON60561.1 hypothetical protein B0920_16410 [Massilia sp. KIM]
MASNKTVATDADVQAYLDAIPDPTRRTDCETLVGLMRQLTGEPPRMWGASIVGFGSYHYRYESGREGDAALVSFSARKSDISIYLSSNAERQEELLAQLGRHKMGKACLQLRALAEVDRSVLEKLIVESIAATRRQFDVSAKK